MSIRASSTQIQTRKTTVQNHNQTTVTQQTTIKKTEGLNAKILQIHQQSTFKGAHGNSSFSFSATFASVQSPSPHCCCNPPKAGLKKDPAGWPKGTVETRGGYKVVPEGKTTWKIFSPDQKPTDKPSSKVWGDPHVYEKDGTKWDFTKDSQFALPDGTRIFADTTSETGKSVSKGLTIRNGNDAVEVRGLNGSKPTVGPVLHPWDKGAPALFNRTEPGRTQDVFHLGGNSKNPRWFRERNGQMQGEVKGAFYDKKHNRYEQKLDNSHRLGGHRWPQAQRPQNLAMGSDNWASQFGREIASAFSFAFGGQNMPNFLQGQSNVQFQSNQQYGGCFGGMNRDFNNVFDAFSAIGGLSQHLASNFSLNVALNQTRFF
ncbi:MAG: DUF1521 domain-containing protein [Deltaproteobacteria bacterium]|nr:DUF1521 domain-containing protein [Deltaproteobacteria bacterium]